jgi:predicted TIM-barrel fold metal-dependent hydrolase
MTDWRTIKKIDAHIHILPDDVHEANPDSEDAWVYADLHKYRIMLDSRGIEKAVIMPLNDPWLMSMEFTIDAVHKNLYDMKQRYPGRFYAFADIDTRNTSTESVEAIRKAIEEYDLDGIKIHPNNTGIDLDSAYNQAIFAYAQENKIPVAIHSYPNSESDRSAAYRIINILEQYPELTVIISHMGAHQWEQLLPTHAYVDISAILPDYVRTYGIAKTNEILHSFGADRLIFATDYPDSRILQPNEIYGSYFDILNQMDFTNEEAEKIAYGNISQILNHKGINHD